MCLYSTIIETALLNISYIIYYHSMLATIDRLLYYSMHGVYILPNLSYSLDGRISTTKLYCSYCSLDGVLRHYTTRLAFIQVSIIDGYQRHSGRSHKPCSQQIFDSWVGCQTRSEIVWISSPSRSPFLPDPFCLQIQSKMNINRRQL